MLSAIVNTTSANLRDLPTVDAAFVGVLAQGDPVDIISDNDDHSWLFVSALVDGRAQFAWIRTDLVSISGAPLPPSEKPVPEKPSAGAKPVGDPMRFTTKPSASGNANGQSTTTGLEGTEQRFDDDSSVIQATETLAATRTGGFKATLTAICRRVGRGDLTTVEQTDYCYSDRKMPMATLFLKSDGIPTDAPAGFEATPVRVVTASQFGKNDRDDEGTGSPAMGLVQTNSEVFGASIKVSKMVEHFGQAWSKNPRRMEALIEVHSAKTGRRVQVPLVDVGPGEGIEADVDLTWACDQFLGTKGQGEVSYRLLIPS